MMKISVYIFLVVTLLMTGTAYADPMINTRTTYYDISGRSNRVLRREMSIKGPRFNNGSTRYWAITRWMVNWNAHYQPNNGYGCSISAIQTTVSIEFTYPRWIDRANARPNMGRQWDRMYQALVAHEETHASHGIAAAKQIEHELLQLSNYNNCNNLRQEAATRAQQIIQRYQRADVQFDQRTHHGANEGVRLP